MRRFSLRPVHAPVSPQPGQLRLTRDDGQETSVLRVAGLLDVNCCQPLWQALRPCLKSPACNIEVDLSEVGLIHPSCALLLVTAQRYLQRRGGRLDLRSASPPVLAALRRAATGLCPASELDPAQGSPRTEPLDWT